MEGRQIAINYLNFLFSGKFQIYLARSSFASEIMTYAWNLAYFLLKAHLKMLIEFS